MRSRRIVSLMAGGVFAVALMAVSSAGAAEGGIGDLLPVDTPSLPVESLLGSPEPSVPLPDGSPDLPDLDPQPVAGGGGSGSPPAPESGSEPQGATTQGGSGSVTNDATGAGGSDAGGTDAAGTAGAAESGGPAASDAASVTRRASTLTGSAGTLAANVIDLARPLSIPLGLMAAAAAALIIATRRPTALRKVDEEGTWGNEGRSYRL